MRWLSHHPQKRRVELLVLAYSPIWMAAIALTQRARWFAHWGDGAHLAFGAALAAPVVHDAERPVGKARLPSFGVVLSDVGRLVRGDRVLATFKTSLGGSASRVQWVPPLRAMVLSELSKSEGCAVEAKWVDVVRIELSADR